MEKFPGKGGWTYARLPGLQPDKNQAFGWKAVSGRIDDYSFEHLKLMALGDGSLFFPVRSSLRKTLGKFKGDEVYIELFEPKRVAPPKELLEALKMTSPEHLSRFLAFDEHRKQSEVHRIYSAKTKETQVKRILELIEKL